MTHNEQDEVGRAIRACREAGLPVIDPEDCTCGLSGRLVVLAAPEGLRLAWPYEERCPMHGPRDREGSRPVTRPRATRSRSQTAKQAWARRRASGR